MSFDVLESLYRAFFVDDTSALRGRRTFERLIKKPGRLERLLRHHLEDEIGELESWWRDELDYLIAYHAMVELACILGVVRSLPKSYRVKARRVLEHPAVRKYYEVNYATVLPRLHRVRVSGSGTLSIDSSSPRTECFAAMFQIGRPLENFSPLETFLWFLDGGARDGVDIGGVIEVLGSKRQLQQLVLAQDDDDPIWLGTKGFVDFLDLSIRLHGILANLEDPILQSACWHRFGYWYGRMNDEMGSAIQDAISAVESWALSGRSEAAAETTRIWRSVLAELVSGRHAWRLNEYSAAL